MGAIGAKLWRRYPVGELFTYSSVSYHVARDIPCGGTIRQADSGQARPQRCLMISVSLRTITTAPHQFLAKLWFTEFL
jgi:hypothetical protein